MQKTIDLSIKKDELGTVDGGYVTNKCYSSYMDNQAWERFESNMREQYSSAYKAYRKGSGGELEARGNYPPKMASFGSSSRMIYMLCRDIRGFHFEYQLPTLVGGIANLDGFLEREDAYIFVEAKCCEPYGVKSHLIDCKYKALYQYLNDDPFCNLNIQATDLGSKMNVAFSTAEKEIICFDIKQMICHLLGIAARLLRYPTEKEISFVYLCYNPKLIEIADEKKKENILSVYDQMCAECNAIDFNRLFGSVIRYLREILQVVEMTDEKCEKMISAFRFTLCDQSDYLNFIR